MTNWPLAELKEVFCLLRMEPACIDALPLAEAAGLCVPGKGTASQIPQVFRRRMTDLKRFPYTPRWMSFGERDGECIPAGMEPSCTLLRSVLRTAAKLRGDGQLRALAMLADAAHNLPEAILMGDVAWIIRIREELQDFCREFNMELLPPDEDGALDSILHHDAQEV